MREGDASACIMRHQAFALAPVPVINVSPGPTAVLGWYPGGSQAGSPYAPTAAACTAPV